MTRQVSGTVLQVRVCRINGRLEPFAVGIDILLKCLIRSMLLAEIVLDLDAAVLGPKLLQRRRIRKFKPGSGMWSITYGRGSLALGERWRASIPK